MKKDTVRKILSFLVVLFLAVFTACSGNNADPSSGIPPNEDDPEIPNPDPNDPKPDINTVAKPVADLPTGNFMMVKAVTLTTSTEGASIYYTTNGNPPTETGTLYKAPITINQAVTIKAIAVKGGMTDSAVLTAEYNRIPSPAEELVAKMKVGWNLGNTLDAGGTGNGSYSASAGRTVTQIETAWVSTATTQQHLNALKSAGFNAIRIPVTWTKVADPNNNYKIRDDWMTRVKQIVGYAVTADMYILLNTHHDMEIFKFMNSNTEAALVTFGKIWEQIAAAFKDYDEKLVFEALNEPKTDGSANEWNGGTTEERNNLNKYYALFVDIVRKSGGKNAERMLLINAYAGSSSAVAMNALVIPEDTAEGRIIVSYHAYEPYNFALNTSNNYTTWSENNSSDKTAITAPMDRYYNKFVRDMGIPIIIGEMGAMNKNDNYAARTAWAKFYTSEARKRGMPCFWWDNAVTTGTGERFGLLNRTNSTFPAAILPVVEALMEGAGVTDL